MLVFEENEKKNRINSVYFEQGTYYIMRGSFWVFEMRISFYNVAYYSFYLSFQDKQK